MSEFKVTLESKLTVVSSRPVKSGKTHKLSGVDHAMGYHTLHLIFYYKNEDKWFGSFELDPLRESLSEVLSIYPTVTGRLSREKEEGGDWQVRCNDAGVRVIKANVNCTIDEWLSSSASGSDETQLIAWDDMPHDPSTWSPFRIQVLLYNFVYFFCRRSNKQYLKHMHTNKRFGFESVNYRKYLLDIVS
jgi:hypothetical protein